MLHLKILVDDKEVTYVLEVYKILNEHYPINPWDTFIKVLRST